MIYILSALTLALFGVTIATALKSRAGQQKLAEQMKLVLQSQHATLGQTQTSDKKLDWLRYEQQQSKDMQEHHFEQHSKALDHHRKSLEHQRVLLASLNRQLQDIDQTYDAAAPAGNSVAERVKNGSGNTSATTARAGQVQTSLKPHPALIRKIAQERKPVSLSQLFNNGLTGEKQENATAVETQGKQAGGTGSLVKHHVAEELGLRRVANG